MKYCPEFKDVELKENHKIFKNKQAYYKERGIDFDKNREFILEKAGRLKGSILEIGSGRGRTALSLTGAGYSIVSVDKDEAMLRVTALNLLYENLLEKAELHLMDAYSLDFKDKSFDNVFMIEALHHVDNIGGIFGEVDRVLKPCGKFIVADFNEKGMRVIDESHREEGGKHLNSLVGKEEAYNWLSSRGYKTESYDDLCHWVLIAEKG